MRMRRDERGWREDDREGKVEADRGKEEERPERNGNREREHSYATKAETEQGVFLHITAIQVGESRMA